MTGRISKFIMAAGAAAAVGTGALMPRPASADTTSTILTAAAAIGAIVLLNNYEHKAAAANAIVGYTRDGGTVYGDGRIVMPDGQTYYPNSDGAAPNQYSYGGWTPNYGYVQNYGGNAGARYAPPAPARNDARHAQSDDRNARAQNDQRGPQQRDARH